MDVTIYHNPRCSKSRETLALLESRGQKPRIIEYLKTPPTRDELDAILRRLGIEPRALLRKSEAAYQSAGFDDGSLTRDELIARMVEHPIVIERPIVVCGERAVIGRPPTRVLELL